MTNLKFWLGYISFSTILFIAGNLYIDKDPASALVFAVITAACIIGYVLCRCAEHISQK